MCFNHKVLAHSGIYEFPRFQERFLYLDRHEGDDPAPICRCGLKSVDGSKLMDLCEAIDEVLEEASLIRLPGERVNVVSMVRRAFARHGCCEAAYVDRIEAVLVAHLGRWSLDQ